MIAVWIFVGWLLGMLTIALLIAVAEWFLARADRADAREEGWRIP